MRKILEDTPPERAEWIVHMQPETFFDDTSFAIPFDSYRDKDLILIGNQTALRNGQMRGESVPQNDEPESLLSPDLKRQSFFVYTREFMLLIMKLMLYTSAAHKYPAMCLVGPWPISLLGLGMLRTDWRMHCGGACMMHLLR